MMINLNIMRQLSGLSARLSTLLALCALLGSPTLMAENPAPAKEASRFTQQANQDVAARFDLASPQDDEDARRNWVAQMPDGVLKDAKGDEVWDTRRYNFMQGSSPASVNPSLWRHEQLNNRAGLFKVTDGIWQVRGYDLANMTLVEGKSGWIVIDPLLTADIAKASFDFAMRHLGAKPVVAVIYTHSHVDHFGGVRGIINEGDVRSGKIAVIAPDGFMEHAVAENVLAGNAMSRRSHYQFGAPLSAGPKASVGAGLGKGLALGAIGLIPPTDIIKKTREERVVDGVRIVFQMANGSEAPSEYTFYFPDHKALCLSEVVTATMHNIYTLRGAKMRDALGWSKYINEMIDLFPEAEVAFRSHHWPIWTPKRIRQHLENQRDAYRYIHDAALHMANRGMSADEIGDATFFPKGLANDFSTHGYYGTLSHNLRAVYHFYLGYYDANPATLNPLPRAQLGQRYVAAMGGANAVMVKAKKAMQTGDYRWAATMNNHLVFAEPHNKKARALQADILEQLGYQAESAIWRNAYLVGAQELREGIKAVRLSTQGPDMVRGISLEMLFDLLAVRLNHQKVDGLNIGINLIFSDTHENYALELSNAVLNNTKGRVLANPNATLTLTRPAFFKMLLAKAPLPQLIQAGEVKLEGDGQALAQIVSQLVEFDPLFPIIAPK